MLDTITLSAIARDLGASAIKERGGKITCTCILARWTHFGGHDTKPSMVIYGAGRHGDPIYKCMGCHEEGTLRDLVLDIWANTGQNTMHWVRVIDGDDYGKAPVTLNSRVMALPDERPRPKREKLPEVVKSFQDGKPFYDFKLLAEAKEVPEISWGVYNEYARSVPRYAFSRGLTVETCKEWQLGHDKDTKRLLFPIRDRDGRLVAISGRLYVENCSYCEGPIARGMTDEEGKKVRPYCRRCKRLEPPKYLHSEGFKRNLVLYGEHRRQDNVDGNVYLVEGHLDMLLLWQSGYRPVVAMLGSYPGKCQIEKLIAYWGRAITIVPDGDKAGVDMAVKVKQFVADRVKTFVKTLPDKRDPGSLTTDEMKEILGPPPVQIET